MATGYIGLTVELKLKTPSNTILRGRITSVKGQTLILQDAFIPATGYQIDHYTVEGSQIEDLELIPSPTSVDSISAPSHLGGMVPPQVRSEAPGSQYTSSRANAIDEKGSYLESSPYSESPVCPPPKQAFVDPAILSVGRKPSVVVPGGSHPVTPTASRSHASLGQPFAQATSGKAPQMDISALAGNDVGISPAVRSGNDEWTSAVTRSPQPSASELPHGDHAWDSDNPTVRANHASRRSSTAVATSAALPPNGSVGGVAQDKRTRRPAKPRKKGANAGDESTQNAVLQAPETTPETSRKKNNTRGSMRAKGWRQTPIIQDPNPNTADIGGKNNLTVVTPSTRKDRRQRAVEARNGWATEDATDIQELPDFDFEGNLSKFDKRSVFDQIRNEDTTADEDRLVSLNRLSTARPGTYGGKNLHPSENVLEKSRGSKGSHDVSSSDDEEGDALQVDSGRNSRRASQKPQLATVTVRQNSGHQEDGNPIATSTHLNRPSRTLNRPVYSPSPTTGSPKIGRLSPAESFSEESLARTSGFRLSTSNHRCPTVTPGGIGAIEEIAEVEFGLSEDIMSENAGRGIAEVALLAINPGGRRLARENLRVNARPVIVVMAGNHKSGARALTAARHLHQRGLRVMACVLGYERGADYDKDLRRQLELFRSAGGHAKGWTSVLGKLKTLDAPPELIVDALLSSGRSFDGLSSADQAVALELVGWANKSKAHVLAVDCPSGVNGSTGEISILEGEPLEVRARFVVCVGAPRIGLLKAVVAGEGASWQLWVVDIGINGAWRRHGIAGGKGVKFGCQWVCPMEFVRGEDGA